MTETRPLRADAVRNRRRILDAARLEMTAHGADAGMDEIARAAGVAVGTLYRHFPTKADLAAAVVAEYVTATADEVEATLARVQQGSPPARALVDFLRRVLDSTASIAAVKSLAVTLGAVGPDDSPDEQRAAHALARLIELGQAAGEVKIGVGVGDVSLLIETAPLDRAPEVRERWLALVLPGVVDRADAF